MKNVKTTLAIHNRLGECPRWHCGEQKLYWVDIDAGRLYRLDPVSGEHEFRQFDEQIGCFVFRDGGGFVVAMRSGFHFMDGWDAPLRPIADPEADKPATRFNDGRCDAAGRFLAGTVYPPKDHGGAALYSLDNDLSVTCLQDDVLTANGVAFSPDNRFLYFSDTPRHVIYRYPYDLETGRVGEREIFHRFPDGQGRPDGASVDREGCYWSALYEGGRIVRLSPAGEILEEIPVPARCPTMVAFGGPDLRRLYVTSVGERPEEELAQYPESGNLFELEVEVPGLAEHNFVYRG